MSYILKIRNSKGGTFMDIFTTYSVRIDRFTRIFQDTVSWYRRSVDFFIRVILLEKEELFRLKTQKERVNEVERLTVITRERPEVKYDFGKEFYKFPSYYRRAAIAEALGSVSSYISRLESWEEDPKTKGRKPGLPKAGFTCPSLYKKNCYVRLTDYTAGIKVRVRNTWDWVTVNLRKSDADYIFRYCRNRKECVPVLRKRGKKWYLDFSFPVSYTHLTLPTKA